jgi:hypothetical protein
MIATSPLPVIGQHHHELTTLSNLALSGRNAPASAEGVRAAWSLIV